jgi:hypothetical protein
MTFNLPPRVTLADIDALYEEADEKQCLSTEVEDSLTEVPLTTEQVAAIMALLEEPGKETKNV